MKRRRLALAIAGGSALATLAIVPGALAGMPAGFPLDDAWIHLVYARSLAHGAPLSFDPGEMASGATSPLWVALLAIVHAMLEPVSIEAIVRGVQALGAIAHLACAILGAEAAWRWTRSGISAAVAGIAIGTSPALACAAISGMEASAAAAAMLGALIAFAYGGAAITGAMLAMAIALRPEAGVLAIVLAAATLAARGRAAAKEVALAAVPVVSVLALIAALNLIASGRPLPATFYFKEQTSLAALLPRLAVVALDMLPRSAPFAGCAGYLFALGALAAPGRAQLRSAIPFLAALAWLVAFAWLVAPDPGAFYFHRYVLPGAPLLCVALAIGAHHLGARLAARRMRALPALGLAIVALGGAVITARPIAEHHASDVRNIDEVQRAMGLWLAANTDASARIAASDVGAVRYFSDRAVLDLMGLNTPGLYWDRDAYAPLHPVTHLAYMPSWLRPTRPELIEERAAFVAEPYTVTSDPAMARQVIAVCVAAGRLPFRGIREPVVVCAPPPR